MHKGDGICRPSFVSWCAPRSGKGGCWGIGPALDKMLPYSGVADGQVGCGVEVFSLQCHGIDVVGRGLHAESGASFATADKLTFSYFLIITHRMTDIHVHVHVHIHVQHPSAMSLHR